MGCISSPIYSKYAWSWSPVICTGVDQLLMLGMETTHLYLGILIMSIKNACWWPSIPYEWEFRPQHIWPSCCLNGGDLYDKVLSNHDLLLSKKKSVDFVLSKKVIIRICKRDFMAWRHGVIQIRSINTRSAWKPPENPNFGFGTTSFRITAVTQLKNQFLGRE